jgi:hypothetical protein
VHARLGIANLLCNGSSPLKQRKFSFLTADTKRRLAMQTNNTENNEIKRSNEPHKLRPTNNTAPDIASIGLKGLLKRSHGCESKLSEINKQP